MIQLNSAGKRYGHKLLFEGADLLITPRDRVGLVGANGTGKSTLLKILASSETLDYGNVSVAKGISAGYLPQDGLTLSGHTVFAECMSVFSRLQNLERELEQLTSSMAELDHTSAEYTQVAERYRGAPRLNVNPDTDETMCIACDLCALACPEHLIMVSSERNEKTRRKELTTFTYDLSRCMFCGLCEDACPTDALELTQDFELANYTRDGAIWNREMLEKGPQPTQYRK